MKAAKLKLAPILLGSLFIAGCKTLTVVPHAVSCDVNAELLAGKCAEPRTITNDTTYAALVDTMQADRRALRECGIAADALRDAIKRCNQATDEYNKKIDALNNAK
jgi:outer membrane murein-binding lipoprotein Lpp